MNTIYRFRSFTKFAIDEIVRNYIYAAKPHQYNDPYDSIVNLYLQGNESSIKKFLHEISGDINLATQAAKKIGNNKFILNEYFKQYPEAFALNSASLTYQIDNVLMWSHYADSHKGICIGYKIENNCLKIVKEDSLYKVPIEKINYVTQMEQEKNIISSDFINEIKRCMTTKYKDWEYEQEYRITLSGSVIETMPHVFLPENSITEIILGAKITEMDRKLIQALVGRIAGNIKIRQAKIDEINYKIKIS